MPTPRILWGQIVVAALIIVVAALIVAGSILAATQWTAWQLGFQPQLGTAWFEFAGWPVTYPPSFLWWRYTYEARAPHIFVESACISQSGGFDTMAIVIARSVWRARGVKNPETYALTRSPSSRTKASTK